MKMISCLTLALALLLAVAPVFAEPYIDNADVTVTDQATGLIWQQSDDGVTRRWQDALDYCSALTLTGKSDWRLPTIKELFSIVDVTRTNPATNPIFAVSDAANGEYWSSTTNRLYYMTAASVDIYDGTFYRQNKSNSSPYTRCVRSNDTLISQEGSPDYGNGS
ncbi:MAG: DUF1566 domain-containing protein [Desulfuromonadales bacterium]|nr:DUF1566 domain-containing protein [Desulfuromonadales bacterium]